MECDPTDAKSLVPSLEKTSADRELGQLFSWTAGFEIAALIGKAHDAVCVADIDVFWIRPAGIEGDSEWLMEPFGEDGCLLRFSIGSDPAEDENLSGLALGNEEVAVWSGADKAGIVQSGGVLLDFEAFRRDGPGVRWLRGHAGAVVDGLLLVGRGKIVHRKVAASARRLMGCIRKCILPGKNLGCCLTIGMTSFGLAGVPGS